MLTGLRFHLRYLEFSALLVLMLAAASAWPQGTAPSPSPANDSSSAAQTTAAQTTAAQTSSNNTSNDAVNPSQSTPRDASSHPAGAVPLPEIPPHPASRLELFGGYSFIDLHTNVNGIKNSEVDSGVITSGAYWLSKRLGLEVEGAIHEDKAMSCYSTAQAGPTYRFFTAAHLSPYFHLDAGTTRMGIKGHQGCAFNFGATAGGGLDYILPDTGNRFAFRILQVDYDYARLKYNFAYGNGNTTGSTNVNVPRFSSGFVLRLGNFERPQSKAIECHTDPGTVLAGDKIVLAAYVHGYTFGQKYGIHWSSTAGKVIYPGPDVLVDTTGVQPGVYSATAIVTRGKSTHALLQCSASFEVKAPPAPTINCSASPSTVNQLDEATITAIANTNPKRELYYSFTASAGEIRRNGNIAKLQTATARPGVINIICRVQDNLGQIAESSTQVTVLPAIAVQIPAPAPAPAPNPVSEPTPVPEPTPAPAFEKPPTPSPAPQPPTAAAPAVHAEAPAPHAQKMCSLAFGRDVAHPAQLDATATACLDELAALLHATPGTRVTLIGNHGPEEQDGPQRAAERTFNASSYLINDKFVDAGRIDIRTGSSTNPSVEMYLLAPGMRFDPPPTEQNKEQ